MALSRSRHIWLTRWILTTVLLILAAAGTAEAAARLPRSYQSQSSVVLLASRSAAKLNGGNPFLSFNASLTLTADVLSRALMAPQTAQHLAAHGFRSSYTVALAPETTTTTGSVLLVTVTGSNRAAVGHTLTGVDMEVSAELAHLQNSVKPYNRIRAATLSFTPRAALSASTTARPVVGVAALGLLVAFGIPVLLDAQIARRRQRKPAVPSVVPEPADRAAPGPRTSTEPHLQPGNWPPVRSGTSPHPARTARGATD
jgi:hypothetical protein